MTFTEVYLKVQSVKEYMYWMSKPTVEYVAGKIDWEERVKKPTEPYSHAARKKHDEFVAGSLVETMPDFRLLSMMKHLSSSRDGVDRSPMPSVHPVAAQGVVAYFKAAKAGDYSTGSWNMIARAFGRFEATAAS